MAPRKVEKKRRVTTRDDVLAAARDVLDEGGLDALTMANVAKRVGFTTMAVYRHVAGRDDLIEGVVDLVLHDIVEPEVDIDWLDGVEAWMHDVRRHLVAHPWVGGLLGSRTGVSPPWGATVRVLTHHLMRGDLSPRDQARALTWVTRMTIGTLIQELGAPISETRRPAGSPGQREPLLEELARMTDDGYFADLVAQTREYLGSMARANSGLRRPRLRRTAS